LAAAPHLANNHLSMDEASVLRIAAESAALKERFFRESTPLLLEVGSRLSESLRAGGTILTFGNGGSAADAQHFAGELVGRFLYERRGLPAIALTTDSSVLTAIGNDMGFEAVFRRQVEAHGHSGDVAFGISTSGRSPNVVEALRFSRARGLLTVALTGGGGGHFRDEVDYMIDVPSKETPRIQEVHAMVIHLLCQMIEESLAPR
jgi:D-sedoheptulose 7-phosphate isomerase